MLQITTAPLSLSISLFFYGEQIEHSLHPQLKVSEGLKFILTWSQLLLARICRRDSHASVS